MVSYICTNCNFRLNSERLQKDCPYCGKRALEKEKSAEELLDEVTGILNE